MRRIEYGRKIDMMKTWKIIKILLFSSERWKKQWRSSN